MQIYINNINQKKKHIFLFPQIMPHDLHSIFNSFNELR